MLGQQVRKDFTARKSHDAIKWWQKSTRKVNSDEILKDREILGIELGDYWRSSGKEIMKTYIKKAAGMEGRIW